MPNKKPSNWEEFSDVGALGIELVLAVFIMIGIGSWLDGRFETSPIFTIIGAITGMAAGMLSAYKIIVKRNGDKSDKG